MNSSKGCLSTAGSGQLEPPRLVFEEGGTSTFKAAMPDNNLQDGGTRWIEDDFSATFSEYIFLFPACLMISHWLTKNAELNSVF